ncbi:MAG: metallopeptidase family protein [Rhodospirillaceae bacterium]|jgi:predicted Zn-dependent protease with MMP-like domain|nr:metallopeptidase family protein [Rhodospirillaceae bacterium]MBT3494825.1 metallopeptidase family protein [Rhodospirillaceae bacterium]MBT3782816.1 metallopeptidase family protein [Rhodospirillaceae bacterium]MBT3976515.1 metallopeptidase family protein [Rhodospirillaceae bacterium]MBT4169018.1 metallopeptidase family protein [Rhodospirillaceae bacterium]
MNGGDHMAPSLAEIEDLARLALARIPDTLRRQLIDVVIQVVDFPDDETMRQMDLRSPYDLLGMYHGINLQQKSIALVPDDLDMIFLYRRPLLDYWIESGENLSDLVRHVLIHEIGHHFGFSDADMAAIEDLGDDSGI